MKARENMSFIERVSDVLEVPGEAMGLPLVTVVGDGRVHIENHRGLLLCGEDKITVECRGMEISVEGEKLEMVVLTEHELLIRGRVGEVRMERKGGQRK